VPDWDGLPQDGRDGQQAVASGAEQAVLEVERLGHGIASEWKAKV